MTPRQPVLIRTKEGQGPLGNARFQACIGALYGMAFTIKMTRKFAGKQDYAVCKLEGQYFGDLATLPKEDWKWKLLIRTPDFVNPKDVDAAVARRSYRAHAFGPCCVVSELAGASPQLPPNRPLAPR